MSVYEETGDVLQRLSGHISVLWKNRRWIVKSDKSHDYYSERANFGANLDSIQRSFFLSDDILVQKGLELFPSRLGDSGTGEKTEDCFSGKSELIASAPFNAYTVIGNNGLGFVILM